MHVSRLRTPEIFDRLAAIRAAKVAIQAAASIAVVPGITSAASPRLLEIWLAPLVLDGDCRMAVLLPAQT